MMAIGGNHRFPDDLVIFFVHIMRYAILGRNNYGRHNVANFKKMTVGQKIYCYGLAPMPIHSNVSYL